MQIKKGKAGGAEVKTKDILMSLEETIKINDIVIDSPGEYEVGGVFITGIPASSDETIYIILTEGMNICYLGSLKKILAGPALEAASGVDLLFLPAGADGSLEIKTALSLLQKINPKIVIPIYLENEAEFLKAEGISNPDRQSNFKLSAKDLPAEDDLKVVILE